MTQYFLDKKWKELEPFPHIVEFAIRKINTIQFDSLRKESSHLFRIYYVIDGRFEWVINNEHYILFPGDLAIVLPGQQFGAAKDFLDLGTLAWIQLDAEAASQNGIFPKGNWSQLKENERRTIWRLMLNSLPVVCRFKEGASIVTAMQQEFQSQEIGHVARINHLLDDFIILIGRSLTNLNSTRRDFPQAFMKLEETLRKNLSHQWTVEEMAALTGLGTTAFSEKVKSFTGFSPLNYLINIRISEAIKMLKQPAIQVTDIALDVGFYSSQHFATTFKKLTGYTPSEFRKNNIENDN